MRQCETYETNYIIWMFFLPPFLLLYEYLGVGFAGDEMLGVGLELTKELFDWDSLVLNESLLCENALVITDVDFDEGWDELFWLRNLIS